MTCLCTSPFPSELQTREVLLWRDVWSAHEASLVQAFLGAPGHELRHLQLSAGPPSRTVLLVLITTVHLM